MSIHQRNLMVSICAVVLISLGACENTAPVTETIEPTTVVKPTPEPSASETVPASLTPEPPTSTPLPTASHTPFPTVEYSTEIVSFTTEDEIDLEGTLFLSQGDTAVVFAHMAGENDQQNWIPFAEETASRGFTALTFNFRCYGGSGCGGTDSGSVLLSRDIGAAIDFLRRRGFERIVCIGASMGGRACVNAAFEHELVGLAIVSGTGSFDPDRQNLEDIVSPDMPKLFIVSENDHVALRTADMTRLYEGAPEPKVFRTFPGSAHGTELFTSKYGRQFREALFDFLVGIR
jgi:dienelactone hydrolase